MPINYAPQNESSKIAKSLYHAIGNAGSNAATTKQAPLKQNLTNAKNGTYEAEKMKHLNKTQFAEIQLLKAKLQSQKNARLIIDSKIQACEIQIKGASSKSQSSGNQLFAAPEVNSNKPIGTIAASSAPSKIPTATFKPTTSAYKKAGSSPLKQSTPSLKKQQSNTSPVSGPNVWESYIDHPHSRSNSNNTKPLQQAKQHNSAKSTHITSSTSQTSPIISATPKSSPMQNTTASKISALTSGKPMSANSNSINAKPLKPMSANSNSINAKPLSSISKPISSKPMQNTTASSAQKINSNAPAQLKQQSNIPKSSPTKRSGKDAKFVPDYESFLNCAMFELPASYEKSLKMAGPVQRAAASPSKTNNIQPKQQPSQQSKQLSNGAKINGSKINGSKITSSKRPGSAAKFVPDYESLMNSAMFELPARYEKSLTAPSPVQRASSPKKAISKQSPAATPNTKPINKTSSIVQDSKHHSNQANSQQSKQQNSKASSPIQRLASPTGKITPFYKGLVAVQPGLAPTAKTHSSVNGSKPVALTSATKPKFEKKTGTKSKGLSKAESLSKSASPATKPTSAAKPTSASSGAPKSSPATFKKGGKEATAAPVAKKGPVSNSAKAKPAPKQATTASTPKRK